MNLAPVARFAVPAGTAAAIVVAREATGDELTDSRRFAAIAALDDAHFRGSFEELVVAGVYTVLAERVLVLRISQSGIRSLAALARLDGEGTIPAPRAGLDVTVAAHGANGFEAQAAEPILEACLGLIPAGAPSAALCLAFAGPSVNVPDGLIVGLRQASL